MNATNTTANPVGADGMTRDEIASKIGYYKTAFLPARDRYVGIVGSVTSDTHGLVNVIVRCGTETLIVCPMELTEYCL